MVMRKFHNSLAVGFFLGAIVAGSQLCGMLFLDYWVYGDDVVAYAAETESLASSRVAESVLAALALLQSILLGSFALLLAAHRTEVLDGGGGGGDGDSSAYQQMPTVTSS